MVNLVTKSGLWRIAEAIVVMIFWGIILVTMELILLHWAEHMRSVELKSWDSKVTNDTIGLQSKVLTNRKILPHGNWYKHP